MRNGHPTYYGIPRPEDPVDNASARERFRLELAAVGVRLKKKKLHLGELLKGLAELHDWCAFWAEREPNNPNWREMVQQARAALQEAFVQCEELIQRVFEREARRRNLRLVEDDDDD